MPENEILYLKEKKDDLIELMKNQEKNLLDIKKRIKEMSRETNNNLEQKILIELTTKENQKYFHDKFKKIEIIENEIENLENEIEKLKINNLFEKNSEKEEELKSKSKNLENNIDQIKNSYVQLEEKLEKIFETKVILNKKKYSDFKSIMNTIHVYRINNRIIDAKYNEINKERLNSYLNNLQADIKSLKQKKINPVINFLLKIITCGFYSKNEYLTKNINIKNKDLNECLLIINKQENKQKEEVNLQNITKPVSIEKINSINLQNQPSTSGYKPSSPKM